MKIYQSPFHAIEGISEEEANKACAAVDYIPTSRANSHRNSWQLRELSGINTEASHPIANASSDSYEPNRLGSQS